MVFLATPVMRTVARMELPSVRAATTCTRLAVASWFICTNVQPLKQRVKSEMPHVLFDQEGLHEAVRLLRIVTRADGSDIASQSAVENIREVLRLSEVLEGL